MNQKNTQPKNEVVQQDMKKLVIARLKAISDEVGIVVGSKKFSKTELLKSVEKEDEIGKEV